MGIRIGIGGLKIGGSSSSRYWTPLNFDYQAKILDLFSGHIVGLWPLQEASGTNVIDVVNGNTALYRGTIAYQQSGINKYKSINITPATSVGGINLYSAGLAAAFNGAEGYANIWIKAFADSSWTTTGRYVLQLAGSSEQITLVTYSDGVTNNYINVYHIAGGTVKQLKTINLSGTRFWNLGIRWSKSGDSLDMFINGIKQITATGLGVWVGALSANNVYAVAGNGGVNTFLGYFSHVLLLNYAPSDADILASIIPTGVICSEGDSRSIPESYWLAKSCDYVSPSSIYGAGLRGIVSRAIEGSSTDGINARAATINSYIIQGKINTLIYWAGVNDGISAQYTYDNTKEYLIAARASGWNKIVLCTEIDAQDATRNTQGWHTTIQPALNALIAADHSFADAIADLGARVELQDATNVTYFKADKLHPNLAGSAVVAEVVGTALATILV